MQTQQIDDGAGSAKANGR